MLRAVWASPPSVLSHLLGHISLSTISMGSLTVNIPQGLGIKDQGHFLTREEIQEIKTTWNRLSETLTCHAITISYNSYISFTKGHWGGYWISWRKYICHVSFHPISTKWCVICMSALLHVIFSGSSKPTLR